MMQKVKYSTNTSSNSISPNTCYFAVKFLEDEIKFKVRNLDGKLPVPEQIEKCNCLPACNALDFDKDISQSSWNYEEYAKIMKSVGEWKQDTDNSSK